MNTKEIKSQLIGKIAVIQKDVEIKINFLKIEYDPEIHHDDDGYSSPRTMVKISDNGSGWYQLYPSTKIEGINMDNLLSIAQEIVTI